ncbi:hypothetical protein IW140_003961 [Coemansia sp. RSA 1813]|nr:hypothetical protein EV178_003865 [Coemansia sp. RSA 1646]KAJ1769874.1 hypothetical protein LPJ74_003663 [Coemansia sp. RSA 1843]KAJ2088547.1 hypothetical protein IW138_004136 [Coemansia sp. RSA 986]KAJ2213428.1 hypothetical protein EV179_003846 [Coemansia sp. RSA 487]KAJ2568324.1 hypothetical protein IW140_003961 [Coemansia sp. RSA 1813]
MQALIWVGTVLLVAALTHIGGRKDKSSSGPSKQSARQQLCDGACVIALRFIHLGVNIHRSFQEWVQSSLNQAGLDVHELLEGDDNEVVAVRRQQMADFLTSLPQRPVHLAVILPEAHEDIVNDVEILCASSLLAKVPRLTVYIRGEVIKDSAEAISSRLRKSKIAARAFGSTPRIDLNSGNDHVEHLGVDTGRIPDAELEERKPDIYVSLWSRNDSYPALSALARELASQTQCGLLDAKRVDEEFIKNRLADPSGYCHPDLVVLVDDLACLPEFPPWQLQNAEMVQLSTSNAVDGLGGVVFSALVRYAKVEKRWGK